MKRCDAHARRGTGTGRCDGPLDEHGQCVRASQHLDPDAPRNRRTGQHTHQLVANWQPDPDCPACQTIEAGQTSRAGDAP